MVKAGVFLLGRIHPIFRGREEWFWIVTTVGMATMLLGAYAAVRKTDLKALLAYSTISQLGLITMLYGFGTHTAALAATFHIFNHAAFKAGLFLVVGIVDHETGTRDKRRLGGLAKAMPITMVICGACALASAGVPLLNGFLSKELFYTEMVEVGTRGWVWMIWPALAIGGSIFTFVYSMEVFHGVFFGQLRMHDTHQEHAPHKPHDPGWGMLVPAGLLATVCVLVGLWPGVLEGWLLKPAVWAVWQQVFDFHVVIWHGFTTPLILSILTMVAGVVLYLQRHRLGQVQERFAWSFTAHTIYDGALNGLIGSTDWLTNKLQNGRLRQYLWWAAATLVAAMLYAAAPVLGTILPSQFTTISGWETVLLLLLIAAAVGVVWRNGERLSAVITVGSVGLLISGLYLVMSAPDLALTQLLVESVTIILFLFVLWRLPQEAPKSSPRRHRASDAVLSIAFGGLICLLVLGVSASKQLWALPEYFTQTSLPEAGGRNIVNVILVDFRGFDTLGEITVLGIAALGAFALLRLRNGKERDR
jgi:multicomponent K+:H+ antiporter subunit A